MYKFNSRRTVRGIGGVYASTGCERSENREGKEREIGGYIDYCFVLHCAPHMYCHLSQGIRPCPFIALSRFPAHAICIFPSGLGQS